MNRPGKYISKMNLNELCEKANELGIFGWWFMLNSELRHCIKKALGMTKEEIKQFDWLGYIQDEGFVE